MFETTLFCFRPSEHVRELLLSSLLQSWPVRSTILLADDDPFLAFSRKSVLERRFNDVQRAEDAAQAFIRIEELEFANRLGLVIVALREPGLAGPQFVDELSSRLVRIPILVVGRTGESAADYAGEHVKFLPRQATSETVLAAALEMILTHSRVA